jgi:hypothetical protein
VDLANLMQGALGSLFAAVLGGIISLIVARYVLIATLNDQRRIQKEQLDAQADLFEKQLEHERQLARGQRDDLETRARREAAHAAAVEAVAVLNSVMETYLGAYGRPVDTQSVASMLDYKAAALRSIMNRLHNVGAIRACERASLVFKSITTVLYYYKDKESAIVPIQSNDLEDVIEQTSELLGTFVAGEQLPPTPEIPQRIWDEVERITAELGRVLATPRTDREIAKFAEKDPVRAEQLLRSPHVL